MVWKRAIGLMSGTSLDGVDVALIESDGDRIRAMTGANGFVESLGPTFCRAYSPDERALLARALAEAEGLGDRRDRPGTLQAAEDLITRAHAEAVEAFMARENLKPSDIDVVGFHGQTLLHRPDQRPPPAAKAAWRAPWPGASASRWCLTCAPPMSQQEARARLWSLSSIAPWRRHRDFCLRSPSSISAGSPT